MPVMSTEALALAIEELQPCVALTGAGMSTESGIPDFRSSTGMWAEVDPVEVASIEAFLRDPLRVWRWYGPRIRRLCAAEPNPGHLALAQLEQAGLLRSVVTQNIDTLHTRAGSRNVVEVHGSIRRSVCLDCRRDEPLRAVLSQLDEREVPLCPVCEAVLKPGVVMFGELLPSREAARGAQLAREARLLLVVGSSLQVWPVAGWPAETLRAGGAVAIVNREETPYDGDAAVTVREAAGAVLPEAARLLLRR